MTDETTNRAKRRKKRHASTNQPDRVIKNNNHDNKTRKININICYLVGRIYACYYSNKETNKTKKIRHYIQKLEGQNKNKK